MVAAVRYSLALILTLLCSWLGASGALGRTLETFASSPLEVADVSRSLSLEQRFTISPTWRGADGAYSTALPDGRVLWLFGDTFIKQNRDPKLTMINNSAAWQDPNASAGVGMQFFWRQDKRKPAALIKPKQPNSWYWPGDGFVLGPKLFLFMKRVVPTKHGPPTFRFDWCGDDLVVVENFQDKPDKWRYKTLALPEKNKKALFGVAALLDDKYAYVYLSIPGAAKNLAPHPVAVARILLSDLSRENMKWQFWCSGRRGKTAWSGRLKNPVILFNDAAPEMTVTRLPGVAGFVCTYMPPLSSKIMIRTAVDPAGPWSEPLLVYDCPEAKESVLGKAVSVYSAKHHPEQSTTDQEMIVTYCANPGDLNQYLARPDLYFPKAIRLQLKETTLLKLR